MTIPTQSNIWRQRDTSAMIFWKETAFSSHKTGSIGRKVSSGTGLHTFANIKLKKYIGFSKKSALLFPFRLL